MDNDLYDLYVATFSSENGAETALKQLESAAKEKTFKIDEAAVLLMGEDEKLKIKETGDAGGGKGAAIGGVIGGAIGLIGGPVAIATGALGAAIGGMAAKLSDSGFPDYQLKQIGNSLRPGMSAIVVLVQLLGSVDLEKELSTAGAVSIKHAPLNKAILTPPQATSAAAQGFLEKAAGATAINLMGEIAHDENRNTGEGSTGE